MKTIYDYHAQSPEWWAQWKDCWWGAPDGERYTHGDPDGAIEAILDDCHPTPIAEIGLIDVVGMRPRALCRGDLSNSLDALIEDLDVEFGDPDGIDVYEPSLVVAEAWAAFESALLADYPVWQCDEAVQVRVDPVQWVQEHRPDWLEAG